MAQLIQKRFFVEFVYTATVDENNLWKHSTADPEAKELVERLFHAVTQTPAALYDFMLREIAFDLTNIGEEMTEVLTGYDIDNPTMINRALDTLAPDDKEAVEDETGTMAFLLIQDSFNVELDHVHVRIAREEQVAPDAILPAPAEQNPAGEQLAPTRPAKQRRHKKKPRRK